jgi:hypothetical protein
MRAAVRLVLLLLALAALWGANVRLYLKDGDHHLVREYEVQGDRVRFYSVERGEWEEIPVALVDLERTRREIAARQETLEREAKVLESEERAERAERRRIARIPVEPGVYWESGTEVVALKPAEAKVRSNKRRSVLKAVSPIPIMGKAFLELDGLKAAFRVTAERPEFYIRLSAEQRFGMIRLTPEKTVRIVEKLTIEPLSKMVMEDQDPVATFRQQLGDGLYKIWPEEPLPAGEYAIVEYTEGKMNIQVWDFGRDAAQ